MRKTEALVLVNQLEMVNRQVNDLRHQLISIIDQYDAMYKAGKKTGRPRKAKPAQIAPPAKVRQSKRRGGRPAGFTVPPEVREKISKSMKGHTVSEETRLKMSHSLKMSAAKRRIAKLQAQLDQQKNTPSV